MPNFCSAGQSARVFFQYPGQPQDNVSVLKAPVEVSTAIQSSDIPFNGGQCQCVMYDCRGTIEYFRKSTGASAGFEPWLGQIHGPIEAIRIEDPSSSRSDTASVTIIGHNSACLPDKNYPVAVTNSIFGLRNLTITSVVRSNGQSDDCGNRSFTGDCLFTVKDADGVVRFEKLASTCPTYEVVCGGNCPPGTVECCGCCLPCAETKTSIQALTNAVRGL
jgi:hypothetical protein